jgi:hypothetical protein
VRVAWYFCIIPWLRRWFLTRKEAQLLHWHEDGRKDLNYKKDGKFRHPVDAAQWGNINTHFPWFDDARSIRFAMSTDGVNPFGNQSSTHNTWPVMLSLYNLPPWICKKHKYMMLTILVSRPKQPGVSEVWDEYKREEFTMHGMLFTTINDNRAHRDLSGESKMKGAACPHYLEDTCAIWLRHSKKYIFMGHRRFIVKCRMDLPRPTTSVGTRTDYSVGPWDYPACATRHLMA